MAFADPLKDMLLAGFGCVGADEYSLWGPSKERWKQLKLRGRGGDPVNLRHLLQTLGTEWGRNCVSETLWIDLTLARIAASTADVILITDVRFVNERDSLLRNGAFVWYVDRASVRPAKTVHSSERDMLDPRFVEGCTVIENNSTKEIFEAAVCSEYAKAWRHFGIRQQREITYVNL